jgi:hypothetical protein
MLRDELASLQLHHDVATQAQVVEEQVKEELLAADFHAYLAADEGEADAHFDQRVADVERHRTLDLALLGIFLQAEESEHVGILEGLLREVRLRRRCKELWKLLGQQDLRRGRSESLWRHALPSGQLRLEGGELRRAVRWLLEGALVRRLQRTRHLWRGRDAEPVWLHARWLRRSHVRHP